VLGNGRKHVAVVETISAGRIDQQGVTHAMRIKNGNVIRGGSMLVGRDVEPATVGGRKPLQVEDMGVAINGGHRQSHSTERRGGAFRTAEHSKFARPRLRHEIDRTTPAFYFSSPK
jgi:hypothetical protein